MPEDRPDRPEQVSSATAAPDLLNAIDLGVAALDSQFRLTYLNAAAERQLGLSHQHLGASLWEALPEAAGTQFETYVRLTANDRVPLSFEHYFEAAARWFAIKTQPTAGGTVTLCCDDITARKAAEQERQAARESLATVINAAEAGWWDLDLSSGTALRSARHDELFGFTAPPPEWNPETAAQRIVPEDRGHYLESFEEALRTGRFGCNFRVLWPDGTRHWLSERGKVYRYDENGRPLRMAGIVMEADEEVRSSERLQEALARDRAIIDAIPEGLLVAAADGTVLAMNPAGLRLHGFDAPQAVRTVADFSVFTMHGPDGTLLPASAWPLARILGGETISGVQARVTHTGTGRTWLGSFSGAPVRDQAGEVALAVMSFRDVTREKQVEDDLRSTVRELTGTLDLTQALIFTMDGTIVFCTSATGRLYGWPREELIGKNVHAFLQTEFSQPFEEITAILLRDGQWTGELKHRRRDGSVIWVASHWALHYDERGNPVTITEVNNNITALKRAEEEVRRSRDHLLLAHKVGDIASWVLDPVTRRAEGPPEAFELFEIDPGAASPADELFARVHPDDLGPLIDAITRGAAEGSFEMEYRYRLRSGETAWMATKGRLQPDGRLLGVTQNITAHRRAEQALRDSEEQFRTLADSITQLAWIARADGYFYWYNRRWYEYTGTTLEQMQGWGWQAVHDATQLPAVLERWRASIATGEPFDMTFPLRGADGVFRPFLSRAAPVRNPEGRVVRWCGTHTDIGERLKYEEAMRRAEARLRRLVESNVVGLVVATSNRVLEANDYFLKMVGYTREDFEAGRIDWSTLTPPEYAAVDAECKRQYGETGVCQAFEKEYFRKDGTRVPILVGGAVIETDPEPQFLCFIVDLTERKMLERRMMQTQKMESVGLLAGGIAHDFNNLLVGVIGNASLAGSMLPRGDPVAELLDRVVKAGEQAAHLTRQILAYSGKGPFCAGTPEPVRRRARNDRAHRAFHLQKSDRAHGTRAGPAPGAGGPRANSAGTHKPAIECGGGNRQRRWRGRYPHRDRGSR